MIKEAGIDYGWKKWDGKCPVCGADVLDDYKESDSDDGTVYLWTCRECPVTIEVESKMVITMVNHNQ